MCLFIYLFLYLLAFLCATCLSERMRGSSMGGEPNCNGKSCPNPIRKLETQFKRKSIKFIIDWNEITSV